MKIIFSIFLIFTSLVLFSQELHLTKNQNLYTPYTPHTQHSTDTINHSALSIGGGPFLRKESVITYYLFSIDYNLHAYEEIYFDFGLSTITDFHNYGFALQISPNLKFNALKNKLSFILGSGFFSTFLIIPG